MGIDQQIIDNLRALAVHASPPHPEKIAEMADDTEGHALIIYYDGWHLSEDGYWAIIAHQTDLIDQAVEAIRLHGDVEGEQRKQWLINCILKTLLGPERYKAFVASYEMPEPGKGARAHWDRGIAP